MVVSSSHEDDIMGTSCSSYMTINLSTLLVCVCFLVPERFSLLLKLPFSSDVFLI